MSKNRKPGNESNQDDESQENIYFLEKIIDIKHEEDNTCRYRVRWKGYDPEFDTWEPPGHFDELILKEFTKRYENLRKERAAVLQENGQNISAEDIVDVNILSKEIEEITRKKFQYDPERRTFYEVKWLGHEKRTWVADIDLIHAQDKVDAFLHKIRVKKLSKKPQTYSQDYLSSHEKRVKERVFYEAVERGEAVSMDVDLYSRVKGRRCSRKNSGEHSGSHINPEDAKEKNIQDCAGNLEVEILSDVSFYEGQKSQREFERLEKQKLTLSEKEFIAAVDKDDYQTLLASLRSDYIPVVDYTALFLKAARRGRRDIALLLATRVKNLSARDEYGNSAVCMAAEQGDICFAHHLFVMGVSRHECNGAGETLQQIASKFGCRHFIRFLQRYEK